MPIYDVGYRGWLGKLTPASSRWWHIGEVSCRLAARSTWVRRLVMFAWLPILYWGVGFYAVEQFIGRFTQLSSPNSATLAPDSPMGELAQEIAQEVAKEAQNNMVRRQLEFLPQSDMLIEALNAGDRSQIRRITWTWLLMTFFRYPQALLVIFLIGFVAPGLISRDFRSRALLLYFSRPIGRREYLLGKMMVPVVFLMLITTLPALTLYVFGLFLSPDLGVILDTWDTPIRVILATLVLILPVGTLALMLSSYTEESRFASFAWFAIWVLGLAAWTSIIIARSAYLAGMPVEPDFSIFEDPIIKSTAGISLYHGLGQVQSWIFGFDSLSSVWPSVLMLTMVTIVSSILLYRNISLRVNT